MAISHSNGARSAMADVVTGLLNAGTIEFQDSGGTEVATCTFGNPAFGAAVNGVSVANAIATDANATGGTVAQFELKASGGAVVIEGTVTTVGGGGDIELSSTVVGAGDAVAVISMTYAAAP